MYELTALLPGFIRSGSTVAQVAGGDVQKIVSVVTNAVSALQLVSGGVGLIFFAWGAFQILTAGMAYDQATKGKQTMMFAAIGLALVLVASTLLRALFNGIGGTEIPSVNG
jgi:hypothetical protein